MRCAMKDVAFDPVPVLNDLDTRRAGRTGNNARRDRRSNFGCRFCTSLSARRQIFSIFCCTDCSASRGARKVAGSKARTSPTAFFY